MKNKIFFFVFLTGVFVFLFQMNSINCLRQNDNVDKNKLEYNVIPLTITFEEKDGEDLDIDKEKDMVNTIPSKVDEDKKDDKDIDTEEKEKEVEDEKEEDKKVDEEKKEEEKVDEEKKEEEKKVDEEKKEEEKKEEEKVDEDKKVEEEKKEIVETFKDKEGKDIANKLPLNFIPENGWYEGWNTIPKSFWIKKDFKAGNDFIILENNGSYISCSSDGELSVTKKPEESNLFLVELSDENKIVRLRSFFGGYLSINPDGSVDCENRNKDKSNLFYINVTNKLCDKDEVNYIIIETLGNTFLSKDAEKIFSENNVSDNSLFKGILFDIGESKCIEEEINIKKEVPKKEEVEEIETKTKEEAQKKEEGEGVIDPKEVEKISLKIENKKKKKDLKGKKGLKKKKKDLKKKKRDLKKKKKDLKRKKEIERRKLILKERKKRAIDSNRKKRILAEKEKRKNEIDERNRRRILRKRANIIKKKALQKKKEKAQRDYILMKKKEIQDKRKNINQDDWSRSGRSR